MVARAWVFRCDQEGCEAMQMAYTELRSVAIQMAQNAGWQILPHRQCRCPEHRLSFNVAPKAH